MGQVSGLRVCEMKEEEISATGAERLVIHLCSARKKNRSLRAGGNANQKGYKVRCALRVKRLNAIKVSEP